MKLVIITGASRGIGQALALELDRRWETDTTFLLLARNEAALSSLAVQLKGNGVPCPVDFGNPVNGAARFAELLSATEPGSFTHVYLVNNAGMAGPIGRLGTLDAAAVEMTVQVNVTTPILVTNVLLAWIGDSGTPVSVLNISSGAARFPIEGLTAYCASKAGLDMFARVAAEEGVPGFRVVSVAPGIIETDMQREIRETPADRFPMHHQFVAFKETGQLKTVEQSAVELADLLAETVPGDVIRSL